MARFELSVTYHAPFFSLVTYDTRYNPFTWSSLFSATKICTRTCSLSSLSCSVLERYHLHPSAAYMIDQNSKPVRNQMPLRNRRLPCKLSVWKETSPAPRGFFLIRAYWGRAASQGMLFGNFSIKPSTDFIICLKQGLFSWQMS